MRHVADTAKVCPQRGDGYGQRQPLPVTGSESVSGSRFPVTVTVSGIGIGVQSRLTTASMRPKGSRVATKMSLRFSIPSLVMSTGM
jgi:hypothetical protein